MDDTEPRRGTWARPYGAGGKDACPVWARATAESGSVGWGVA
jgi:hypothetical protein